MARTENWRDRNAAVLRARALRREPTPPEYRLWLFLRQRPDGLKFRRQHPFEHYTADFYSAAARLVVEIDGAGHSMGDNPERDARRDASMRESGLQVLRFNAEDVIKDVESVVRAIVIAARR